MKRKTVFWGVGLGALGVAVLSSVLWVSQATATRHPVESARLGKASDIAALIASLEQGATVSLKTIESADWTSELSGLLNLKHPRAQAEGLEDHAEKIKIYTYHINHPVYGDFMVDSGVSQTFANDPESNGVPDWLVPKLGLDTLDLLTTTEQYLADLAKPLQGVFLTHLHIDHISGLPAVKSEVPIFVGRGEASEAYFLYAATRGTVDVLLDGRPALQEWQASIVDVFEDGSLYAIHSPGHTAGSTSFLVNTDNGPVLLTGDASHTAWGWEHEVEPGKFSTDQARSRESLNMLIQLVKDHPQIQVKLGHQAL